MRGKLFITASVLLCLTALPANAATSVSEEPLPARVDGKVPVDLVKSASITGTYVITLVDGNDAGTVASDMGVTPLVEYDAALDGFAARLNGRQLQKLQGDVRVESIENDQRISLGAIEVAGSGQVQPISANGPYGLDRIDQRRLPLSGSYTYGTTGKSVSVYVFDSGIATGLSDFGGRADSVLDVFGGDGRDCNGHGTHVAGTIGGKRFGVAKQARLRSVRVLDCTGGGTLSGFLEAVDWVQKNAEKPAVANMSLTAFRSRALNKAVNQLSTSGVAVAVAAGNNGKDSCQFSPASAKRVLAVAATDAADRRADFSSTGPCVDLYAPGVDVVSLSLTGKPIKESGTSMSSPHVAGVMARLKSNGDVPSGILHGRIRRMATGDAVNDNAGDTPNLLAYIRPR